MGFVVLDAHLRFVTTRTQPSLSSAGYAGLAAAQAVSMAGLPEGEFAVEAAGVLGVPEGHVALRLPGGEVVSVPEDTVTRAPLPPPAAAPPAGAEGPGLAVQGCAGGACGRTVGCAGAAEGGACPRVLPAVGHAGMDAEHAALAEAFRDAETPADVVLQTYCERHDARADPRETAAELLAAVAEHTANYDALYERAVASVA